MQEKKRQIYESISSLVEAYITLFLRIDVACPRFQMQRLQTTKKISESKSLYRTLTGRTGGGEAGHSSVIGIRPGILPPSDVSQPSAPTHFRNLLLRINQLHRGFTRSQIS